MSEWGSVKRSLSVFSERARLNCGVAGFWKKAKNLAGTVLRPIQTRFVRRSLKKPHLPVKQLYYLLPR